MDLWLCVFARAGASELSFQLLCLYRGVVQGVMNSCCSLLGGCKGRGRCGILAVSSGSVDNIDLLFVVIVLEIPRWSIG